MPHHFVCSECGYTSHFPGVCQNDLCLKQNVALTKCHCEDDQHGSVMTSGHSTDSEEGTESGEESTEEKTDDNSHNTSGSVTMLDLDA